MTSYIDYTTSKTEYYNKTLLEKISNNDPKFTFFSTQKIKLDNDKFKLSIYKLNADNIKSLIEALKNSKYLETIDLCNHSFFKNINYSDIQLKLILESISQNTSLKTIHWNGIPLNDQKENFIKILSNHPSIEYIYMDATIYSTQELNNYIVKYGSRGFLTLKQISLVSNGGYMPTNIIPYNPIDQDQYIIRNLNLPFYLESLEFLKKQFNIPNELWDIIYDYLIIP